MKLKDSYAPDSTIQPKSIALAPDSMVSCSCPINFFKRKLINFTSEMQLNLYFIVWYDNNEDDFICEKQWQRTNEDWFHKYSCRSSRASEICQRPSLVTSVTHPQSNLYMKRWTRLVIDPPRASSTDLAMWPSQNFSFSLSCSACLVNLHQAFLSSSCWDLWNQLYEESHLFLAIGA